MNKLPNPHDALASLETAIARREVTLQNGEIDPTLKLSIDAPGGKMRMTYVRMNGKEVVALMMAVPCEPYKSVACFHIGYAVAVKHRNQGHAKAIIKAAIAEMRNGFFRNKLTEFYLEAIVGEDNPYSIKVAEKSLSNEYKETIDSFQKVPVRQYLLHVKR